MVCISGEFWQSRSQLFQSNQDTCMCTHVSMLKILQGSNVLNTQVLLMLTTFLIPFVAWTNTEINSTFCSRHLNLQYFLKFLHNAINISYLAQSSE